MDAAPAAAAQRRPRQQAKRLILEHPTHRAQSNRGEPVLFSQGSWHTANGTWRGTASMRCYRCSGIAQRESNAGRGALSLLARHHSTPPCAARCSSAPAVGERQLSSITNLDGSQATGQTCYGLLGAHAKTIDVKPRLRVPKSSRTESHVRLRPEERRSPRRTTRLEEIVTARAWLIRSHACRTPQPRPDNGPCCKAA